MWKCLAAATGLLVTAVGLWWARGEFLELSSRVSSLANCQDDGLGKWRVILEQYSMEHAGRIPDATTRIRLAAAFRKTTFPLALTCNMRAEYRWNPAATSTRGPVIPVVRCGVPHGFRRKWVNVLFSDFTIRSVPVPPTPGDSGAGPAGMRF